MGHYRVEKDYRELVWYLLDSGLDPNHPYDLYGEQLSALQYAEKQAKVRFVEAVHGAAQM